MTPYYTYLVQCADTTYYTGVCTDLERRLREHNSPRIGARYTRTRQPVRLLYSEAHPDRSSAQKREYALKQLSHQQKASLVSQNS